MYGLSKKQIEILLVELRKLRGTQPELRAYIELIEKFLVDFDRFAATQRVIGVPKEVIVEKEVNKAVLVPVKDSASWRSELALSLLVEKLILEIKRIKKSNPNVQLNLDEDVSLIFFAELFDKQNIGGNAEFTKNLKDYTQSALAKFSSLGGNWTNDHELMLNTVLEERFAMANLVKQANLEIEKVRAISDKRAEALKEKETQFLQVSKSLNDTYSALGEALKNNPTLQENIAISRAYQGLGSFTTSSFAVKLD